MREYFQETPIFTVCAGNFPALVQQKRYLKLSPQDASLWFMLPTHLGYRLCFLQKFLKPSWKVYILVGAGNTLPVSSMCRKHVSLKRFSYFLWNMYHKWVWRVWEQYVWWTQHSLHGCILVVLVPDSLWLVHIQIEAQPSSVSGFWYRVSLIPRIMGMRLHNNAKEWDGAAFSPENQNQCHA